MHFKVEAFGGIQNQVLSAFGKSESFTKSGTYAKSEKSDEKKEKKLATVIVGIFSPEKRRLKTSTCSHNISPARACNGRNILKATGELDISTTKRPHGPAISNQDKT